MLSAILAAATIVVGCNKPQDSGQIKQTATNAWQDTKQATTQIVAKVKEGAVQAWTDIKESISSTTDYTYDKKDAFVAGAQADLNALDQKIAELSNETANVTDSTKVDAQTKLQALHDQRAVLNQKLNDVKNATGTNWNDAKSAFSKSYDDCKNSVKDAWNWLSDQLS